MKKEAKYLMWYFRLKEKKQMELFYSWSFDILTTNFYLIFFKEVVMSFFYNDSFKL